MYTDYKTEIGPRACMQAHSNMTPLYQDLRRSLDT